MELPNVTEETAAAAIEIAEVSLTLNETDQEKAVTSSPINGIFPSRDVEKGQTVAASLQAPVLFTLAEDIKNMELQVEVDEADVGLVKEGQRASFSVDAYADQTFHAEITRIRYGSETTDGMVTCKTVLKVAYPDLLLRPGMTTTAEIVFRYVDNILLMPSSAFLFSPTQGKKVEKQLTGTSMHNSSGLPYR